MGRALGRGLLAFLLVAAGIVLSALPASAHASLVSSTPAEGEVVQAAPEQATFTFDEPVQLRSGGVQVFDAAGQLLESSARTTDATLVVDLPDALPDGSYVVSWRVVSADGHPVAGSLTFSVGSPSASVVSAPTAATAAPTSVTVAQAVVQCLRYLGAFAAIGLAFFLLVLLPRDSLPVEQVQDRLGRVLEIAAVVGAVAAVLLLPLAALEQQAAGWARLLDSSVLVDPLTRTDGLAAGLLVAGLAGVVAGRRRGLGSLMAAGAVLGLVSFALVGHTRSAQPTSLVVAADLAHVAAGSVWFGGLIGLVVSLRRLAERPALAASVLSRFSSAAAWFLGVVVVAGSVLAWRILGSWSGFFDTASGRTLLVKLGVFGLVVAVATVNRLRLLPALAAAQGFAAQRSAAQRVRQAARLEAVLLVGVLAATGVLVDRSPEPSAATAAQQVADTGPFSGEAGGVRVAAHVDPASVGRNTVYLHLQDEDGQPLEPYAAPRVRVSLPEADLQLGTIALEDLGDGTYAGQVVLPTEGDWLLRVSVRTSEFDNPVVDVQVPVSPRGG
ncbi:MAG TPA: copper resistance protein CopC [Marmoricola sp.]|nr:copper resistance protein CopC [Marmoricola sp.]